MNAENQKKAVAALGRIWAFATDFKILVTAIVAIAGGVGSGMYARGDAGAGDHIDRIQAERVADSISKANDAPLAAQLRKQDSALMRIFFRQDVQMSEGQKRRADSLMDAALSNINYGGSR